MNFISTPTQDQIESVAYAVTPILTITAKMLTPERLAPLLAMAVEINLRIVIDEKGQPVVLLGIPLGVLEEASEEELARIVELFPGMAEDDYHPMLRHLRRRRPKRKFK